MRFGRVSPGRQALIAAGLSIGVLALPAVALPAVARADDTVSTASAAETTLGDPELVSAPGIEAGDAVAAAGPAGRLRVAYVARAHGTTSIHVSERRRVGGWTAPIVLSTAGADALSPVIASGDRGFTCVAWVENSWAQQRVNASCRVAGVWQPARALGPLAARIDTLTIAADGLDSAVLAFVATQPDLTTRSIEVATFDGSWSAGSALDLAEGTDTELAVIDAARVGDRSGVLWGRPDALLASTTGSDGTWAPAEVLHAGAVDTAALGAGDARLVAAWQADAVVEARDLSDAATTTSAPNAEADRLIVAVTDSGAAGVFAIDSAGDTRLVLSDGQPSDINVGSGNVETTTAIAIGSAIDIATLDDSSITRSRIEVEGAPGIASQRTWPVEAQGVADVVLGGRFVAVVWGSNDVPTAVLAARTSPARRTSPPVETPLAFAVTAR